MSGSNFYNSIPFRKYGFYCSNMLLTPRPSLLGLLICLLIGCSVSVVLGQDANWDLKNYHLYNAYSYLNNRLEVDALAAGIQTYFHPLLDIPYYWLSTFVLFDYPRILAFVAGIPYGFLIFLVLWISAEVFFALSVPQWRALSLLATVFGVTGAATLSQAGTTFNEVTLAVFVLAGLVTLLFSIRNYGCINMKAALVSGVLIGTAAGLKLTAVIYAPAAVLAVLLFDGVNKKNIGAVLVFCLGWWLAFLVLWGVWGYQLYQLTGNPLFPMFNHLFGSSWMEVSPGGMDNRFKPTSWFQALFYPFYWIIEGPMTVAEPSFADPRFAVGFIAFLGVILLLLFNRSTQTSSTANFILIFIGGSYILWETLFSILRYAVAIEALLGIVVGAFLVLLARRMFKLKKDTMGLVCFLVFSLLVISFTNYPHWGRKQYAETVFADPEVQFSENTQFLLLSKPLAYFAPILGKNVKDVSFIGINEDYPGFSRFELGAIIKSKIAKHTGDRFAIFLDHDLAFVPAKLDEFNLEWVKSSCRKLDLNINAEKTYLCSVKERSGESQVFYFNNNQVGTNVLASGWSTPEAWGVWSNSVSSRVNLPIAADVKANYSISFNMHAYLSSTHPQLTAHVFINGQWLQDISFNYPSGVVDKIFRLDLPDNIVQSNSNGLTIEFKYNNPKSPKSLALSSDERLLGVGLVWIKLTQL